MTSLTLRTASQKDLQSLVLLENESFEHDKLSKRRFKHWIDADNGCLIVAQNEAGLVAYALIITRKTSRVARLYSIAVHPQARGKGVAQALLSAIEKAALQMHRLYVRLEVATNNMPAINLYKKLGYRPFDVINEFYEDKSDALRMQKSVKQLVSQRQLPDYPWIAQITEFSCGPASLLMAMMSQGRSFEHPINDELQIWRRATSIFMTSGHGGSHPIGLALAASDYGFESQVLINAQDEHQVLFVDGVRKVQKKQVMQIVHDDFVAQAKAASIPIQYTQWTLENVEALIDTNWAVLCLISTYLFDGRKAPHWVFITAFDNECVYLHDPDFDGVDSVPIDYQHIPVLREDFLRLASFGQAKLRTLVAIKKAR